MDQSKGNESLEAEGIFIGKPSKQDLINYFMKQQRLATIKKLEENDREISPELSESFEIYLEQKKKKIELEKIKLKSQYDEIVSLKDAKICEENKLREILDHNVSTNDESFLELEKMCENTLNLNNVSELLTDLTMMDGKNHLDIVEVPKEITKQETNLYEIEQPSYFLNNTSFISSHENSPIKIFNEKRPSTIIETTETSLSYKTAQSHFQSIISTDKSEYYQTANDKTVENSTFSKSLIEDGEMDSFELSKDQDILEKSSETESPHINDTLDEIDFLLAQANKMKSDRNVSKVKVPHDARSSDKTPQKKIDLISPFKTVSSPRNDAQRKLTNVSKMSPLMTFSPVFSSNNKSPLNNFKLPKQPTSSSKMTPFSKLNSKKFQHIVSPVSRYIQTSESVLNANAHVQYKANKRHFNFRDSENFDKSVGNIIKSPSLPLRVKTSNTNFKQQNHNKGLLNALDKYKIVKDTSVFANNTLNESEFNEKM